MPFNPWCIQKKPIFVLSHFLQFHFKVTQHDKDMAANIDAYDLTVDCDMHLA